MIGNKLKEARKNANLSQEQVAEILNTSRSNISKYENGNLEPNIQTLKKFCEIYNISADYLIGLTKNNDRINNNISIKQGKNSKAKVNIKNQ